MRRRQDIRKRRVHQFKQINASWSIEGQVMDARDLLVQRRIAERKLTLDGAIRMVLTSVGLRR